MVERLVEYGRPYHYGLEAGSKPELLAVMALLDDEEALIICNGYKDEEYIETALLASQARPPRHPRGGEALRAAADPRHRQAHWASGRGSASASSLSTRGSGRWEASGGDRSKFGLSGARHAGGGRLPARARHARLASSCSISTSAARSPPSARSRTACARRPASTSTWSSSAPRSATSTSAAAWASTTTARRRTSPRRSTTPCRSTPTTSSSA